MNKPYDRCDRSMNSTVVWSLCLRHIAKNIRTVRDASLTCKLFRDILRKCVLVRALFGLQQRSITHALCLLRCEDDLRMAAFNLEYECCRTVSDRPYDVYRVVREMLTGVPIPCSYKLSNGRMSATAVECVLRKYWGMCCHSKDMTDKRVYHHIAALVDRVLVDWSTYRARRQYESCVNDYRRYKRCDEENEERMSDAWDAFVDCAIRCSGDMITRFGLHLQDAAQEQITFPLRRFIHANWSALVATNIHFSI